ncbi:type II toxin-antitoxin system HicA family toxin [Candidatus Uhrbacteria bacterium]|nr:type II toxin-antitoxin system HicA family toxin [Candidatus Uhrbacteria bacterium]
MSPRLPRVTARQVMSALQRAGFCVSRQSGSHIIFKKSNENRVTVPFHGSTILHPKILKSILKDSGISVDDFINS